MISVKIRFHLYTSQNKCCDNRKKIFTKAKQNQLKEWNFWKDCTILWYLFWIFQWYTSSMVLKAKSTYFTAGLLKLCPFHWLLAFKICFHTFCNWLEFHFKSIFNWVPGLSVFYTPSTLTCTCFFNRTLILVVESFHLIVQGLWLEKCRLLLPLFVNKNKSLRCTIGI